MELWPIELWHVAAAITLCAAAGLLAWRRRSARSASMSPVVYDLLWRAEEQGGYMAVEFSDHETGSARFLGPCLRFDPHTLVIDVGQGTEHPEWTGETVRVNFRLSHKKSTAYYQFVTRIESTRRENGSLRLIVSTPKEILSNQKRRFVRIMPLHEAIHGLGIWSLERAAPRPNRPSALGRAPLRYRQDQEGPLSLVDISAAGLRLGLRLEKDAPEPAIRTETRLLCLLMLHPAAGGHLSFWLDCTVVNTLRQDDRLLFGLKFDAWASASGKDLMEWLPSGENGWIGPLGTWVWRQQLEQVARNSPV